MRFILITLISFTTLFAYGQSHTDRDGRHNHEQISSEQVESLRIAFLTKKLDLSPAEAQSFWPLYNEYSAKKSELKSKRKQRPNLEELNDIQTNKLLDEIIQAKQSEIDLDKTYVEKFREVLPAKKVMLLFISERKFKEEILRDVKRRLNETKE